MAITIEESLCNDALDLIGPAIDAGSSNGVIQIRSGSMPLLTSDPDAGSLLAELDMSEPSMLAAASKAVAADTISPGTVIADGTATHFRVKDSNGVVVLQGTVGTSAADMILNTTTFTSGGQCQINSFTLTLGA